MENLFDEEKYTIEKQRQKLRTQHEEQEFLEKLHHAASVLHRSLNKDVILDSILEQVENLSFCDAACVLLLKQDVVRVARWYGYARFSTDESFTSFILKLSDVPSLLTVLDSKEPQVVSSVADQRWRVYGPGESWVKSHITVPICFEETVLGFLKVDSSTPDFFEQIDAFRLQFLADQAGVALHNSELYDQARQEITSRIGALKQERNFFSAVIDSAAALVIVLTPQGRILRFNQTCERLTGYTLDEIRGKHFWDIFLPKDAIPRVKSIFEATKAGNNSGYESTWFSKTGIPCTIIWSNTILQDNERNVDYVVSTGVDVTARRQLEDRLSAIHQLGRELNLLRNETEICQIVFDTAAFLLHYKSAGFGILDQNTGKFLYSYQPIRGVPKTIKMYLPIDTESRIYTILDYQKTANSNDREESPFLSATKRKSLDKWLTAFLKIGNSELVGVLDVQGHLPGQFSLEDYQLLQTLADQTAVAIENARLHRERQQRIDELTTLALISQTISSTLNLKDIFTLIANHTIRLLNVMAVSVVLSDPSTGDSWFSTASGGVSDFVEGKRLSAGQGIVGWVIQHGKSVLIPDVAQDERFFKDFDQLSGFKTESVICVPMKAGQQNIGAIEAINKKSGSFNQEDLRLLTWLATPASIAIKNGRLFEAERAARHQTETLQKATSTLTASLDLDKVLNDMLLHLEKVVPFDNAYVFLQKGIKLQIVAAKSANSSDSNQTANMYHYPTTTLFFQEIQRSGSPVIIADVHNHPDFGTWELAPNARSWMGVPLVTKSKVIGCLTVDTQRIAAYREVEIALVEAFANQAAVAIHNALLFKQVHYNHKHLQSLSRRLVEIQEAERRRIARELHDEAGQALTSLIVGLRVLENEVSQAIGVETQVTELKQIANSISKNLHRLAKDLRPASLDYLGLVPALRQVIQSFAQQYGLVIEFEAIELDHNRLPPPFEINLYRIVQEALTNVVRHAKATRVDIFLEPRHGKIIGIIEDNGVGFNLNTATQKERLGLLGMRERVEMLGGTLVVETAVGAGTTIQVEIPYDNQNTNC